MELDRTALDHMAVRALEEAQQRYGELDFAFVRTVAIVMEVDLGNSAPTFSVCSDDRVWTHRAFLEHAVHCLDDEVERMRVEFLREHDGEED
jgi:hypothetical protein